VFDVLKDDNPAKENRRTLQDLEMYIGKRYWGVSSESS
jgi:hypothetical protein